MGRAQRARARNTSTLTMSTNASSVALHHTVAVPIIPQVNIGMGTEETSAFGVVLLRQEAVPIIQIKCMKNNP